MYLYTLDITKFKVFTIYTENHSGYYVCNDFNEKTIVEWFREENNLT